MFHLSMTLGCHNGAQKFDADAIFVWRIPVYELGYVNVLAVFSVQLWLESGSICKNNDCSCLFHYIYTCLVPLVMFEYLAQQPHVQTASSGPGKC